MSDSQKNTKMKLVNIVVVAFMATITIALTVIMPS